MPAKSSGFVSSTPDLDDVVGPGPTGVEGGQTIGKGLAGQLLNRWPSQLAGRRIDPEHAGHENVRPALNALRVDRGARRRVCP
jgi:hypothetical protein